MINLKDIEVEYKFKVNNKAGLTTILNKIAIKKFDRQYQCNVMFDNNQGLMQRTDGRLRVRVLGKTGNKMLTYKKPLLAKGGAKREIEYEIKFRDQDEQIEKILEAIEFTPTTSYERYQSKWRLGNIHITLDEYPFTTLVEIEGTGKEIKGVSEQLGFDVRLGLTMPVDTLFQEWRKERGLSLKTQMKFDDFDK